MTTAGGTTLTSTETIGVDGAIRATSSGIDIQSGSTVTIEGMLAHQRTMTVGNTRRIPAARS